MSICLWFIPFAKIKKFMFISFYRLIKFAFQDFWRNKWLSLVTIIILILTFLTISFLIIFNITASKSINLIQDKIDVSVYFKEDVPLEKITQSQFQLLSLASTKNIRYVSSEQALENFKIKHSDNKKLIEILGELDGNPLGASLIITAKNVEGYSQIIDVLNSNDFKDIIQNTQTDFNDYRQVIDKISLITNKVKKIGIIASIVLAFITLLIVFYTIKIAIYTHKDEIAIMRLVGAGNIFIKAPFLIESIFFAVIASILSIAILYPILKFLSPHLEFFIGSDFNILTYFKDNISAIMGWQLFGAILLNLISSSMALGKYLKA